MKLNNDYLEKEFKDKDYNNTDYANYLFEVNKIKNINKTEFVIKSNSLLENYRDNQFWLQEPKKAFEFLLNEIIKERFSLDYISYVLPNDMIMAGFEKYIMEYINSRDYIEVQEKKKLKKLAKEKQLDALLEILIRDEFLKEQKVETSHENDAQTLI